jgi:hypothetical protein
MNLHCERWRLDFDICTFCIEEEKRREEKEEKEGEKRERRERERAQMGEMGFADTRIEERESE